MADLLRTRPEADKVEDVEESKREDALRACRRVGNVIERAAWAELGVGGPDASDDEGDALQMGRSSIPDCHKKRRDRLTIPPR